VGEATLPPTVFAVEHVEPRIDAWLWLEYTHCAQLVDRLVFTGVKDPAQRERLATLAEARAEPAAQAFAGQRLLVLDPRAKEPLRTADFEAYDVVVIGGILGFEQLDGRTERFITAPHHLEARHLGPLQLPIDMAVLVTNLVRLGLALEDIELTTELEVDLGDGRSVELPYAYPVVEGQVLVTPGLVQYLVQRGVER
jgi:ribosome biogenesis SPOUT family RNA methylase Rps3